MLGYDLCLSTEVYGYDGIVLCDPSGGDQIASGLENQGRELVINFGLIPVTAKLKEVAK